MLNSTSVKVPYIGATPGADASTYNLFSTVVSFPGAMWCSINNCKRLVVNLTNPQSLTLKGYTSSDRGLNWVQVYDSGIVAAPAAGQSNTFDLLISEFPDFKLDVLNAGSAQTGWNPNMELQPHQVKVT